MPRNLLTLANNARSLGARHGVRSTGMTPIALGRNLRLSLRCGGVVAGTLLVGVLGNIGHNLDLLDRVIHDSTVASVVARRINRGATSHHDHHRNEQ